MAKEIVTFLGHVMTETSGGALLLPKGPSDTKSGEWVPRSVVPRIHYTEPTKGTGVPRACVFDVEDWYVRRNANKFYPFKEA